MADTAKAIAVVTMTVSIELTQSWDGACTLEQIQKQARRSAEEKLASLSHELKEHGIHVGQVRGIRVVLNEERFP